MTAHSLNALLQQPRTELLQLASVRGLGLQPHLPHYELVGAILSNLLTNGDEVTTSGVLTILPEGFGFVRMVESSFAPTAIDAYVSPNQIRTLNLQLGHQISGTLRNPRGTERFHALVHIDTVHGAQPDQLGSVVPFAARTPTPSSRILRLAGDGPGREKDNTPENREQRTLQKLAPWCFGHRVLLHQRAGFSAPAFLGRLARGIAGANPAAVDVTICLLEQRPEDVARLRDTLQDESITLVHTEFAAPPEAHVTLADTSLHRAMRQVEQGRDAILLLDSLTALTRGQSRSGAPSGAWIQAGLDARSVLVGKRLLAAARQCQEGGSLTVLAGVQVGEHGSLDAAIAGEFAPYSNSDVHLEPRLADSGHPLPFDLVRTRTRHEDDLSNPAERQRIAAKRSDLIDAADPEARAADWLAWLHGNQLHGNQLNGNQLDR